MTSVTCSSVSIPVRPAALLKNPKACHIISFCVIFSERKGSLQFLADSDGLAAPSSKNEEIFSLSASRAFFCQLKYSGKRLSVQINKDSAFSITFPGGED